MRLDYPHTFCYIFIELLVQNNIKNYKGETMKKIDLRNSVTECAQSVKKENAGKYYNYSIADCMKSIVAQK